MIKLKHSFLVTALLQGCYPVVHDYEGTVDSTFTLMILDTKNIPCLEQTYTTFHFCKPWGLLENRPPCDVNGQYHQTFASCISLASYQSINVFFCIFSPRRTSNRCQPVNQLFLHTIFTNFFILFITVHSHFLVTLTSRLSPISFALRCSLDKAGGGD